MNHATPFLFGLSPVCSKEIVARFDDGRLSSDGGVLLLREVEARPGVADLPAPLPDARDPTFKLTCGRLPEAGDDLISQPTLSRRYG